MRAIHCLGCFTYSTLRDYWHNHASTCHGGQRDLCVATILCLRPLLLTMYFSHYHITSCSPSKVLDTSIYTYTRHERQATANTYFCAHFVSSCRLFWPFFPFCKFVKMNFPGVFPSLLKFHTSDDVTLNVLYSC